MLKIFSFIYFIYYINNIENTKILLNHFLLYVLYRFNSIIYFYFYSIS